MDVGQIAETARTVKEFFEYVPLAAGVAAGFAALALYSGVARVLRRSKPELFPAESEAAQPKYVHAFTQLTDKRGGVDSTMIAEPEKKGAALVLCSSAFQLYENALVSVAKPPRKTPKKS